MPETESHGNDAPPRYTEIHASSLRTTVSLRLPSRSCQQVYVRPSYISRRLHATAIRRSDVCTVSDIWLCCSCVPYAGTYRRAKDRVARKWKNDKIQEESTKILRRGRWMLCCVPHVACTYFKLWVFERRWNKFSIKDNDAFAYTDNIPSQYIAITIDWEYREF